jgi:PilZ domain
VYKERRHVQRYDFAAAAEVEDSVCVCQARVADLSIAGAYLVLPDFFPQGASVLVKIRTKTAFFQCDATVAHSSPHGMGMKFHEISPPFLVVLQEWLLEAMSEPIEGAI